MEAAQSLPELSKHLSVLKRSDAADATIISTLFALNGLNPTVSDLNSSRIHIYLSQNVAKRSGVTGELARHLIAKWKRLLPSSSSQSPPSAPPCAQPHPQELLVAIPDVKMSTMPPRVSDGCPPHVDGSADYQQLLQLLKGGESQVD